MKNSKESICIVCVFRWRSCFTHILTFYQRKIQMQKYCRTVLVFGLNSEILFYGPVFPALKTVINNLSNLCVKYMYSTGCVVNIRHGCVYTFIDVMHMGGDWLLTLIEDDSVWDIVLCSLKEVDWHFIGTYCLHHQGDEWPWWWRQYAAV
jgi:hypothetical protein